MTPDSTNVRGVSLLDLDRGVIPGRRIVATLHTGNAPDGMAFIPSAARPPDRRE